MQFAQSVVGGRRARRGRVILRLGPVVLGLRLVLGPARASGDQDDERQRANRELSRHYYRRAESERKIIGRYAIKRYAIFR